MKETIVYKLIAVYLVLAGFAWTIGNLITGYLGKIPSGIYSFPVSDGWCTPATQGIGDHCFGDYYYPVITSNWENPWGSTPNPNPPLTQFIFKIFAYFPQQGRSGLLIYLVLCLLSVAIPFIYAWKKLNLPPLKVAILFLFTLTSAPFMVAFDRGAIVMALFTPLFFVYIYERNQNVGKMQLLITLLVLLKPQFLLLNLIFVKGKRYKILLRTMLIQSLAMILTFTLYYQSFPNSIISYARQAISFQSYIPWGSLSPSNLSLTNVFGIPLHFFGYANNLELLRVGVSLCFLLILLKKVVSNSQPIANTEIYVLLVLSIVVFPGVSFAYYGLFVILCLVVVVVEFHLDGKTAFDFILKSNLYLGICFCLSVSLFIPWPIRAGELLGPLIDQYSSTNLGINWLFSGIALNFFYLLLLTYKPKNTQISPDAAT